MSTPLDIFQTPACPHLCKGICMAASIAAGVEIRPTAPVCNVTCKSFGGPYCSTSTTTPSAFLENMLLATTRNSVNKVRKLYGSGEGVDVIVPAVAGDALTAFADVLAIDGVTGIGMSGSSLISGAGTSKDVDIVLLVKSLRWWHQRTPTVAMPTTVAGLPVDVFVRQSFGGVFMTLDIRTMTLHTSSLYKIKSHDARIVSVVDSGAGKYTPVRKYPHTFVPPAAAAA